MPALPREIVATDVNQDGHLDLVALFDGYRDNTNGTPTCYVLMPGNGSTPLGQSDVFCAIPGHSDFDITK